MPRDKKSIKNDLHQAHGIDFDMDFHMLRFAQQEALAEKAKEVGYRKTKHANGSLGRCFFEYLNK